MIKRDFGRTGWKVSAIGQGCWNIGNQWGTMDDATADRIVKTAFDSGMNLFDVAESYGDPHGVSEIRVGRAIKGFRDQIYLVSKIAWWGARTGEMVPKTTADMIRLCGHGCCGRMRTDYIDVMLCHDGTIEEPSVYIEGFEALKEEGFIREYGISTDSLDVLRKFNDAAGGQCAVVECNYSVIDTTAESTLLPYCQEQNIAVLARAPLAAGLLSARYDGESVFTDSVRQGWNRGGPNRNHFESKLAEVRRLLEIVGPDDLVKVALQYIISHPSAPVAIPGATRPEQAKSNAAAGVSVLPADRLQRLRKA